MFPEIIPAAILVIGSPGWGIRLAIDGYILQALVLWITAGLGLFGFMKFMLAKKQWIAHLIIGCIIFVALAIHWSLPTSERFLK